MNLRINNWYGRLGNNIIQIINCIQISMFYENKYNIILPNHRYFNTNYIKLNDKVDESFECLTDCYGFYYQSYLCQFDAQCFCQNIECTRDLIRTIFIVPENKIHLDDDDLVVHIRSGDLFRENPLGEYIPSPLCFYSNIILSYNWRNIYVLSEDKMNPVIDILINRHKNILFKIKELDDDISIILQARTIVMDIGTFVPTLLLFSKKIKTLYNSCNFSSKVLVNISDLTTLKVAYFYLQKFLANIEINDMEYDTYRLSQLPWKNSMLQRKILLQYSYKPIIFTI